MPSKDFLFQMLHASKATVAAADFGTLIGVTSACACACAAGRKANRQHGEGLRISAMDKSLKYECVYLHAWETGSQAKAGIGRWITFYNHQRLHAAHGGQPPAVLYFNHIETDQQGQRVA